MSLILMNDFRSEPKELLEEELKAAERVLKSGWFILGNEVEKFERAWADYCGAKFAVGVGNGMDAIEIGLRTLNIGPGDEVITTPMTAAATVLAIRRTGATPVFADIDPTTALLDTAQAEKCISKKTKAILVVHLYGQVRAMNRWRDLCHAHNLFLLEDCAQAHGASEQGGKAGTFGIFGAFSFYPTKNLGARGDGGAIITDSEEVAEKAKCLRNYGQQRRYVHCMEGLNSRLDEMQAALLAARLPWLDRFNQKRKIIAARYREKIANSQIELPTEPVEKEAHVYHLFVLRCSNRDALALHLKSRGIETLIHYPVPMHQQPFARDYKISLSLSQAEEHARCCLSIPCHPQLTPDAVESVIETINSFIC